MDSSAGALHAIAASKVHASSNTNGSPTRCLELENKARRCSAGVIISNSSSPQHILEPYRPTPLARNHDVQIAVPVDVNHGDVHAGPDTFVERDHVFDPFGRLTSSQLVPIDSRRIVPTQVVAIVSLESFPRDQVGVAVFVEVRKRDTVCLCSVERQVRPIVPFSRASCC